MPGPGSSSANSSMAAGVCTTKTSFSWRRLLLHSKSQSELYVANITRAKPTKPQSPRTDGKNHRRTSLITHHPDVGATLSTPKSALMKLHQHQPKPISDNTKGVTFSLNSYGDILAELQQHDNRLKLPLCGYSDPRSIFGASLAGTDLLKSWSLRKDGPMSLTRALTAAFYIVFLLSVGVADGQSKPAAPLMTVYKTPT